MPHTVSAVLGIVTALLVGLAVGVTYGYVPSASVDGLTGSGVAWLAGLGFIAAAGAYLVEEANWSKGFTGRH
jgi:hypothetical protein